MLNQRDTRGCSVHEIRLQNIKIPQSKIKRSIFLKSRILWIKPLDAKISQIYLKLVKFWKTSKFHKPSWKNRHQEMHSKELIRSRVIN